MKLERKLSVHNCFEVEVRDAKTGKVKRRGRAENIVLNNWKIFSVPSRIYFGSGTDESQENVYMTGLIEHVGSRELTKVSSTWEGEYRIIGFQSGEVKANEYVGKRFAEVGIYDGSKLISHAFIRDSEGNLLSFVKKDTDVVVFYATVYYHMPGVKYKTHPKIGNIFDSTYGVIFGNDGTVSCGNTVLKSEDRRYTCVKQIQNDVLNNVEIRTFFLKGLDCNDVIVFPTQGLYEGTIISKEKITGMNGIAKEFDLKWNAGKDIRIFKNNILLNAGSDYTLNTKVKPRGNLLKYASNVITIPDFQNDGINIVPSGVTISYKELFMAIAKGEKIGSYRYEPYGWFDYSDKLRFKDLNEIIFELSEPVDVDMYSLDYGSGSGFNKISISLFSEQEWKTVYEGMPTSFTDKALIQEMKAVTKVRMKMTNPILNTPYKRIPWIKIQNSKKHMVTFQNAPLSTDVLEADYRVDYVPKDENHVLKLNYDLIMTPGVSG